MKDIFDEKPELSPVLQTTEEYKQQIIDAAKIAVVELIKVLREPIITNDESDVSSDRLKNSVAAKKLAMMDALDMIARADEEQRNLDEGESETGNSGFAERHARGKK